MLEQHRISGFVTDRLVGAWQIKQSSRPFVPIGEMLYSEKIGIPVCKDREKLLAQLNEAVLQMKSDGTLKKIYNKYFGINNPDSAQNGEMTFAVKLKKLLKGFSITLLIAFSSIILGFLLAVPVGLLLVHKKGAWLVPSFIVRGFVDLIRGTPGTDSTAFRLAGTGTESFPRGYYYPGGMRYGVYG